MLHIPALAVLLAFPALAEDLPEAPKSSAAVDPATATPEQAVRQSLILMKQGKPDEWIKTWCTPARCETTKQKEELKQYMLKQAQQSSKNCLHGDEDALEVKGVKGDPETDPKVSITLKCTHTEYPPPAVVEKVDGRWYVTSIPW